MSHFYAETPADCLGHCGCPVCEYCGSVNDAQAVAHKPIAEPKVSRGVVAEFMKALSDRLRVVNFVNGPAK